MSTQGDYVVLRCTGANCGMRYPSPFDDPRRLACPLCDSPTEQVGVYKAPPAIAPDRAVRDGHIAGVLDNIRSALNVGSMLRSADGAGLDHVVLGGLTAGVDNPKVIKTALGAQQSVATSSSLDLHVKLNELRSLGYEIWAVDYTPTSVPVESLTERPERLAFVVGNEIAGVDPAILDQADRHVHLSMRGTKTTLNVGVVFGTVAYLLPQLPVSRIR